MKKSLLLFTTLVFLFTSCGSEKNDQRLMELEVMGNGEADSRENCDDLIPRIEIELAGNTDEDPDPSCSDLKISVSIYNNKTGEYCTLDEVSFRAYTSGTVSGPTSGGYVATTFSNNIPVLSPAYTFTEIGIDQETNAHYVIIDGDRLISNTPMTFCIDYLIVGEDCGSCELTEENGPPNSQFCALVPPHCL